MICPGSRMIGETVAKALTACMIYVPNPSLISVMLYLALRNHVSAQANGQIRIYYHCCVTLVSL